MGEIIPEGSIVSVPACLWEDWSLQCYMVRYFNISLDPDREHKYFVKGKDSEKIIPENYKRLPLQTRIYELYKIQD